jgi:hypothetical protein
MKVHKKYSATSVIFFTGNVDDIFKKETECKLFISVGDKKCEKDCTRCIFLTQITSFKIDATILKSLHNHCTITAAAKRASAN